MVTRIRREGQANPHNGDSSGERSVVERLGSGWLDVDRGINMCLYGESGTGKTRLWGTFPGPILAAICSGSDRKSGELITLDTPENRKKIKPILLRMSNDLLELITYAESGKEKFGTFVLDHVSGLQDLTLAEILGVSELPAQKSWGMATLQQYGASTNRCKDLLRQMMGLPMNVIIVAQERAFNTQEDAGEGSELLRPNVGAGVTRSLKDWLHPACDYVCQMYRRRKKEKVERTTTAGGKERTRTREVETGETEFCLRTAPDPVYASKFRTSRTDIVWPDCIVDPSYDKIMELISPRTNVRK